MDAISERICHIPSSTSPLSSDIFLIRGDTATYLFDVGYGEASLQELNKQLQQLQQKGWSSRLVVVLSHFHIDHKGNLSKLTYDNVFLSEYTKRHLPDGESRMAEKIVQGIGQQDNKATESSRYQVVSDTITVHDDVCLDVFLIPTCHAKGSLALTVDHKYTLLGDATYPTVKFGKHVYNVQYLKEEIDLLKSLNTEFLLISHSKTLLQCKETVIRKLELLYEKRDKNEAYIELPLLW